MQVLLLTSGYRVKDARHDQGGHRVGVIGALDSNANGNPNRCGDGEDESHDSIGPGPEAGLQARQWQQIENAHTAAILTAHERWKCMSQRGALARVTAWLHKVLFDVLEMLFL